METSFYEYKDFDYNIAESTVLNPTTAVFTNVKTLLVRCDLIIKGYFSTIHWKQEQDELVLDQDKCLDKVVTELFALSSLSDDTVDDAIAAFIDTFPSLKLSTDEVIELMSSTYPNTPSIHEFTHVQSYLEHDLDEDIDIDSYNAQILAEENAQDFDEYLTQLDEGIF